MKKLVFFSGIIFLVLILSGNRIEKHSDFKTEIYYVDHSMLRLIPVDYNVINSTKEKAAKKIIETIIEGQDYNRKILRVIPDVKNCIGVKIKDRTAYVDLKKDFQINFTENKNHQLLAIYSIVNSLTSIDGVDNVEFLIDGEKKKINYGGIDMREVFIPDYYI